MTRSVWLVFAAGAFATLAFDSFGQAISPLFGQARLAPVPLANSMIDTVFGTGHRPSAYLLHIVTGLVAYSVVWAFVIEPVSKQVTPWLPSMLVAALYGVGLWVFALYGMAHLVAGMKPFLGFSNITWVALVGHVVYALVLAQTLNGLSRSRQPLAT